MALIPISANESYIGTPTEATTVTDLYKYQAPYMKHVIPCFVPPPL